jgi:peptidoglycan hydrolase-like protein with peptidoglycan-binding domain
MSKSRRIVSMLLVLAVAGIGIAVGRSLGGDDTTGGLIITPRAVERRSLSDVLTVSGEVRRDDLYTVSSSVDGRVSDVIVAEGDTIESGDRLIAVDGRTSIAVDGTLPFYRSLTVGSEGPDVAQLERILAEAGYDIESPDTLFTEETRDALAAWQIEQGYASGPAETDETVTLTLSPNPAGYVVGRANSAAFTIVPSVPRGRSNSVRAVDNRPAISVSVSKREVVEGGVVTIGFTADSRLEEDLTVEFTVSGTASVGEDYETIPRSIVMPRGSAFASFDLTTLTDEVLEGDEDLVFTVVGGSAGEYQLASRYRVSLVIQESSTTERRAVNITAAVSEVAEGGTATFTLRTSRRADRDLPVSVQFSGTAEREFDYVTPTDDQFVIRAGTMSTDVVIRIRDDGFAEPAEFLTITVVPEETDDLRTTYTAGLPSEATVEITSGETPELTVVGGGRIPEGSRGSFRIVADEPVPEDTSINYQLSGTATPGVDYRVVTGTVVMRAGTSSVSVPIDTLDDDVVFQPSDMVVAQWPVRVGSVGVEIGDLVSRGTPLFELAETAFTIALVVGAAERAELEVGQRVSVDLTVGDRILDGLIVSLDDSATLGANGEERFEGIVEVDGEYEAVDGAKVTVDVVLAEVVDALAVPVAAVLRTADGDVVRVVADDGTIDRIPVTIGLVDREWVEVVEGLIGDELVVVDVETEGRTAAS